MGLDIDELRIPILGDCVWGNFARGCVLWSITTFVKDTRSQQPVLLCEAKINKIARLERTPDFEQEEFLLFGWGKIYQAIPRKLHHLQLSASQKILAVLDEQLSALIIS